MDFSKFRQSGDLSDLTVTVDEQVFKLHKFPLYAKSEYFCKLAHSADVKKVELVGFPGGPEIFSIVADFCYNMKIDLTKNNIVQVRCAAEFLQMKGEGNLIDMAEKFFNDTITSTKMSRSTSCIASLLLYASAVGELANVSGIVNVCCEALIECWLKPPTKFNSPTNILKQSSERREDKTIIALLSLPLDWFMKLVIGARDRGVQSTLLAELSTSYISVLIDREESDEKGVQNTESGEGPAKSPRGKSPKKIEISKALDNIITVLPEESLYSDVITIDWLTKVIRVATSHNCKCRKLLVKSAGELLSKLSAEDLCIISPSLLRDIVQESCSSENGQIEKACRIVDTYMSEMVRKGVLTAETFKLLATVVPKDARSNHDQMYNILEYVLTTERENLSQEQRQELIETVNFTLLNEETLQSALSSSVVPATYVAKGAIALCTRLRTDLETARATLQRQDDEIKRLKTVVKRGKTLGTPIMTSSTSSLRDTSFGSVNGGRDPELELLELPTKDQNADVNTAYCTSEVLSAVRNKLAASASSPYNTFRPLSQEHDISYEEELEYKHDRAIRPLEHSRTKSKPVYGASYRTYSAYTHRY
ncbi:uncharacterized protein LOC133181031 [Saccostrea echinata]|uniref:uncharacterized protein LOC133181031 n=1 Tax=Saccostrea echinata TaxID=191078 RepID=UPI002A83655E|nr:uncharacterized protein LOC133181031 [Saccostrea echinata]